MKYIEFVKVDAGDGFPETEFPLRNGPADPVPGIGIIWWSTDSTDGVPRYFGAVDDDTDLQLPGIVRLIDDQEWADLVARRRKAAQVAIDSTAGVIRVQFVSAGQFIEQEYRLAQDEVAAWRAAGSDAEAAPDSVKSGAVYAGVTVEQAAVEIEQSALIWTNALLQVRDLRLRGKRLVLECPPEAIATTMQNTINLLQELPTQLQVPVA